MDTWCPQWHHQHMLYLIWISKTPQSLTNLIGWNFLQSNGVILKTCLIPLSSLILFVESFFRDFLELLHENFRDYWQLKLLTWNSFTRSPSTSVDHISQYDIDNIMVRRPDPFMRPTVHPSGLLNPSRQITLGQITLHCHEVIFC